MGHFLGHPVHFWFSPVYRHFWFFPVSKTFCFVVSHIYRNFWPRRVIFSRVFVVSSFSKHVTLLTRGTELPFICLDLFPKSCHVVGLWVWADYNAMWHFISATASKLNCSCNAMSDKTSLNWQTLKVHSNGHFTHLSTSPTLPSPLQKPCCWALGQWKLPHAWLWCIQRCF